MLPAPRRGLPWAGLLRTGRKVLPAGTDLLRPGGRGAEHCRSGTGTEAGRTACAEALC